MIIYLRTVFPGETISPVSIFLSLVELESIAASVIASTLLTTLNNIGLSGDFLRKNFVGFTSDVASVMLGRKAGVAKMLSYQFPRIIVWHCIAHRLKLSVHDSVTEVAGINSFKYNLSCVSQKLQRCATALDVQLMSIGRMPGTRWVASSYRTLKAVWQSYSAL